jgi:hypothetical protein
MRNWPGKNMENEVTLPHLEVWMCISLSKDLKLDMCRNPQHSR